MWYSFVFNAAISIIIIILIHYLWEYCKNTYTSPKNKCIYEFQESKYKQIAEDIIGGQIDRMHTPPSSCIPHSSNPTASQRELFINAEESTLSPLSKDVSKFDSVDFLQQKEKEWIQNELGSFITTL